MGVIDHGSFEMGLVTARSPWRAGAAALDCEMVTRALVFEAQEFGADGVAEIAYAIELCQGGECEGVTLQRLVATGRAIRRSLDQERYSSTLV